MRPEPTPGYSEALVHLYGLRRFGMRPGLGPIEALLHELGDPQRRFRSVHVTGSKGKGSTSAMAESILRASGRRTGLFTSPHLASYRERIRISGAPVPPDAVVDGLGRVREAVESLRRSGKLDREPTFFETTTALAFDRFAAEKVDVAVVEVGIGGRLDSTNVLDAPVAVLTTVELEHTDLLGTTVAEIAREKAGILRPGQHALFGPLPPGARAEADRKAYAAGIPVWHLGEELTVGGRTLDAHGQRFDLTTPTRAFPRLALPLFGSFQPFNAALAVAAADRFVAAGGGRLPITAVRSGLKRVVWRGRMERLEGDPDLFLDVAHTPESARAVAESLAEISPFNVPEESALLFGCLAEKRVEEILEALAPVAQCLVIVPVASSRSAEPSEVRRIAAGRFSRIVEAPSAIDGLMLARAATGPGGLTLVVGSDYLVGEILRAREGLGSDEPDLSDPGLADGAARSSAPGGRA